MDDKLEALKQRLQALEGLVAELRSDDDLADWLYEHKPDLFCKVFNLGSQEVVGLDDALAMITTKNKC